MATTYLTVSELKASTQNERLIDQSTTILENLIVRAERYVDAVAGYWEKYDSDQDRIFPRLEDIDSTGATFIHNVVKEATAVQAEFLFLQTPDDEDGIKSDDKNNPIRVISPRMKALMQMSGLTKRTGKFIFRNFSDYDPDRL